MAWALKPRPMADKIRERLRLRTNQSKGSFCTLGIIMTLKITYDEFIEAYVDWAQEIDFVCRGVNYFIGVFSDSNYIYSRGADNRGKTTEYKTRQELVDNYKIEGLSFKEIIDKMEIRGII